jgi:SEC-C motif-containing protein
MLNGELCPCCSGLAYNQCCGPYHNGIKQPENARALMCSRFSAYALGLVNYIINTTHPENVQYLSDHVKWKKQIDSFVKKTKFQKLEVLDFTNGDEVAFVTFKAHLIQENQDNIYTEKSRFIKVAGRWLYHSGQVRLGK